MQKLSVVLIGAGSMGGAMLKGWLESGLLDTLRSAVVDPMVSQELSELCAAHDLAVNPAQDQTYDICVLAIKPQLFPAVLPNLSWPDIDKSLFISIAAGQSIEAIRIHLKSAEVGETTIIRAMPNLPSAVGRGYTLLCTGESTSDRDKEAATALVEAVGSVLWLDSEEEIDMATGVSGCGPAYVFLLAEAMAEAGVAAGFPEAAMQKMARETVIGAAAMMASDTRSAEELRKAVTSPGGATAAALSVLDDEDGLRPIMKAAITKAFARTRELAG